MKCLGPPDFMNKFSRASTKSVKNKATHQLYISHRTYYPDPDIELTGPSNSD